MRMAEVAKHELALEEERQRVAEVERARLLTSEQLEEEKRRREDAIAKLEHEKHSMMKEQEARHKAIASEKEELRTTMMRPAIETSAKASGSPAAGSSSAINRETVR